MRLDRFYPSAIWAAIIVALSDWADRKIVTTKPDVTLTGHETGTPFLERWHIIPRNWLLNIYLHHFVDDDPGRDMHDHPWPSLSICLTGDLIEETPDGDYWWNGERDVKTRRVTEGDIRLRSASFTHRLLVAGSDTPVTIFITGPKIRIWGFNTCDGWRRSKRYLRAGGIK